MLTHLHRFAQRCTELCCIPPEVPPLSILFHAEGFEELPECSLASGATGEATSGPPVGKQTQQWTSQNVPILNDLKLKHVFK